MFRVLKDGRILGYCDSPNFVKRRNGIWVNCPAQEAEAIAINSIAEIDAIATELSTDEFVDIKTALIEEALCDLSIDADMIEEALCDLSMEE